MKDAAVKQWIRFFEKHSPPHICRGCVEDPGNLRIRSHALFGNEPGTASDAVSRFPLLDRWLTRIRTLSFVEPRHQLVEFKQLMMFLLSTNQNVVTSYSEGLSSCSRFHMWDSSSQ